MRANEEHLRQAAKMEAIGRLAGGIAHDFNNQIQALLGFADLLSMDASIGANAQQDVSDLRKAAERMGSLTQQLLAFSRQQVLELARIDLNAVVQATQPMLQRLIGSHIDLRLELGAGPSWVKADRAHLEQVLFNLTINARDALPAGGEVVIHTGLRELRPDDPDMKVHPEIRPGAHVELRVSDTGIGIAAEDVPHIFEPFFTTKGVGEGTGLGLATVHGIVAQCRGAVWAEARPGSGTTFVILLPSEVESGEGIESATSAHGKPRHRILVVEDEEFVRRFLVRALERAGYEVLEARHGREALELLGRIRGRIDLIISDVVMPVMGGEALAIELSRSHPEIQTLFMSAYAPETAASSAVLEPFLSKPVSVELLLRTVEGLLRAKTDPP
jgi:CheY-like chemotaxis protein